MGIRLIRFLKKNYKNVLKLLENIIYNFEKQTRFKCNFDGMVSFYQIKNIIYIKELRHLELIKSQIFLKFKKMEYIDE